MLKISNLKLKSNNLVLFTKMHYQKKKNGMHYQHSKNYWSIICTKEKIGE